MFVPSHEPILVEAGHRFPPGGSSVEVEVAGGMNTRDGMRRDAKALEQSRGTMSVPLLCTAVLYEECLFRWIPNAPVRQTGFLRRLGS